MQQAMHELECMRAITIHDDGGQEITWLEVLNKITEAINELMILDLPFQDLLGIAIGIISLQYSISFYYQFQDIHRVLADKGLFERWFTSNDETGTIPKITIDRLRQAIKKMSELTGS